jgi:hypothetical protein
MRLFARAIGFCLLMLGLYFLGQNIYFTNNVYPYWWRGVAADTSILFLTAGILSFFVLPRGSKIKNTRFLDYFMGILKYISNLSSTEVNLI